ncbi:DNase I-like protein [Coniochaeta ligniaria NRRL 30616]|uniref:DNase I-like protein n=1 Tax=Coniochaeta ligniaria NRRL 30616 TaxID=1408157 RepID=A0A1J7JPS0_9PEZI|nr:DNase I-like protein [Coniochaeta ligniaria NRRL 30616]
MAPSTLDLLFITFNCAKNLINPAVFANHLHGALLQNSTGLPDLVVFSLQEVAPLSYSFIGSYFMTRYYSPYEEALNRAAARVLTTTTSTNGDAEAAQVSSQAAASSIERAPYPYTLVRAKNVGMTAILLFARDPAAIHHIQEAMIGFGVQDMGNKGAVGLRVTWSDSHSSGGTGSSTELTFVATHLAAMEWNLKKRNANWRTIVSGLTFKNPKKVLPNMFPAAMPATTDTDQPGSRPPSPASASSSEGSEEEDDDAVAPERDADSAPLLTRQGSSSLSRRSTRRSPNRNPYPDSPDLTPAHLSALQEVSIFKPTSHLFLGGDLNYRISSTTPPARSPFPSFYHPPSDPLHWSHFLPRDQLTAERAAGRTLNGLTEAPITFGPSYKYDVLSDAEAANAENFAQVQADGEVPWRWAPHRWPSWCDRVLFLDLAPWVKRRQPESKISVTAYDILPLMRSSDHRPVFLRATVPVLGTEEMAPPPATAAEGEETLRDEDVRDPRIVLPVPIDPYAWERRAAARRREVVAGWSMFVWATKEGATLIGTALLVAGATWWLWRVL